MIGERVPEGLLVRLKPGGAARFFPAAFLTFWLCGWAFGEFFAIRMLVMGALSVMNGTPFEDGQSRLGLGFGVAAGGFLLFWLAIWTVGGAAAMSELLRLLWSEDRIIAHGGGLTLAASLGPFRFRREFPRDEVRRIVIAPRNRGLVLETTKGNFLLSRSGSREEREEAIRALHAELGLSAPTSGTEPGVEPDARVSTEAVELPKGWQEIITPEGERALAPDVAIRKTQARMVSILGFVTASVAMLAVVQLRHGPAALPFALITTILTLALVWGAVWLSRGRMEWRIGSGRITLRRRFGPEVKDVFEAVRLELGVKSDSDNDPWYVLDALNDTAESMPKTSQDLRRQWKSRRRVASALRNPLIPRQLGAWLSRAAGIPLKDTTTPEAREAEMKALRDQLATSGPLGRAAARLLEGVEESRRKSA
jgi:hypothetical protein